MGRKVKYTICVSYRVWDYVDVILDEDQNVYDAYEEAERISFNERNLNDMYCDHDLTEDIEREYIPHNYFLTPKGKLVEVDYVDDVDENKGGYYCEVFDRVVDDDTLDNFVIHKEDIEGLGGEDLDDKLQELTKEYLKGVEY